jgi:hypothetical protein
MDDELRKQIIERTHAWIRDCGLDVQDVEAFVDRELAQLIKQDREAATRLQPFEVADYKRLLELESRGIEEYREMRAAPALTAEAIVSFINQLSPWNLRTTGIDVLNAYVKKQLTTNSEAKHE